MPWASHFSAGILAVFQGKMGKHRVKRAAAWAFWQFSDTPQRKGRVNPSLSGFQVLVQEQGDDEHADNGGNADHKRAEGLGLVAILGGHFAEVGDDPEVRVVGVGHRHGTCADGDNRQASPCGGVQSQNRKQRRHDAGGGGDGDGGGALCGLQDRGQQEREEDTDALEDLRVGLDVVDHVGGRDDLTKNAAGGGDEQDRANGLQGVIRQLVEILAPVGGEQADDGDDAANGQSDDGSAQEADEVSLDTGHGESGSQTHQDDGNNDGRKGQPCVGQLAELGNQLLVGLDVLVIGDVVSSLDLLTNVLREEITGDQRRDGAQSAQTHDQQQIVAAAQRTGCRDGAGRGRNEAVADIKTHGQSDGHRNAGCAGAAGHSLTDGVQDDEAAVAEHGDGDDPAHQLNGDLRMLLTHKPDNAVGHLQSRAGAFQQSADQSAKDNDDADAGERTGEAGADDVCDTADGIAVGVRGVNQRDSGDQAKNQRNGHDGEERMDFQLADGEDHQRDGKNEYDDKSNTCHKNANLPSFCGF